MSSQPLPFTRVVPLVVVNGELMVVLMVMLVSSSLAGPVDWCARLSEEEVVMMGQSPAAAAS